MLGEKAFKEKFFAPQIVSRKYVFLPLQSFDIISYAWSFLNMKSHKKHQRKSLRAIVWFPKDFGAEEITLICLKAIFSNISSQQGARDKVCERYNFDLMNICARSRNMFAS